MGLSLVLLGLRLRPTDEILTTEHEFHSTHEALRMRAESTGATVRRVRLYTDPAHVSADEPAGRLIDAITDRTRFLVLTWVHSSTGVMLPIRTITDAVAGINAGRAEEDRVLVCVDGVHGFGTADETPADLGCDLFVSGTHKRRKPGPPGPRPDDVHGRGRRSGGCGGGPAPA